MASQSETDRWRQQELALTAVEHRLQALGEYLAVYRASYASSGEGRHYARVRMLRQDIGRLLAWWWYLHATRRGASWLPLIMLSLAFWWAMISAMLMYSTLPPEWSP